MDLRGKVALVTGGAHRIGRGLVLALAEAGCDVVLHYHASAAMARQTAQEVVAKGRRAVIQQADLANPAEVANLIKRDVAEVPIQILINNAAIFPQDTLLDISPEAWEKTIRVNLLSPIFLIQAFAHALPEQYSGAIINITDSRVERSNRFSYSMAKGGLNHLTLLAAATLAPRIRVNAIALGAILPPPGRDDTYMSQRATQLPLQRVGGFEPVSQAMLYLLQNDFVTGEIIRLDGGAHLK